MKLRKPTFPITLPPDRLTQLGVLINPDFTGGTLAACGYTKTGTTATWTVNGDGTIPTTSTANSSTDFISYTAYGTSVLEDLVGIVDITVNAIDADSTAFAIGLDGSNQGVTTCMFCELLINTGATNGTLKIWQGTFALRATGATKVRIAAGDKLRLYFNRNKTTLTFTVENLMNGSTESVSYLHSGVSIISVNGYFAMWNRGGNYTITKHKISSTQIKNIKTIVRGDSISAGFTPTVLANRYYTQLGLPYYSSCNLSAGSIRITGTLASLPETLLFTGTYAILMVGGNDLFDGVPAATWKANYASLVSQLKSTGWTVIHCTPTPRNGTDVTPLRTEINTVYAADLRVDTYAALWSGVSFTLNAAYDSGDGTHPNDAGHALLASTILATVPQIV